MLMLMYFTKHGVDLGYREVLNRVADRSSLLGICLLATSLLDSLIQAMVSAGGRSLPVASASLWNALPSEVTLSEIYEIFRSSLKTFFPTFVH